MLSPLGRALQWPFPPTHPPTLSTNPIQPLLAKSHLFSRTYPTLAQEQSRMIKKIVLWLVLGADLLLIWVALDDITTGYQHTFTWEWMAVILSIPLIAGLCWALYRSYNPARLPEDY